MGPLDFFYSFLFQGGHCAYTRASPATEPPSFAPVQCLPSVAGKLASIHGISILPFHIS